MQGDEAAAKSEEIGGAHHEGLQELLEIATGAEFGGDLKQLMKFMRLGVGVAYSSACATATAPKPAMAETSAFSSAVKTPSCRG